MDFKYSVYYGTEGEVMIRLTVGGNTMDFWTRENLSVIAGMAVQQAIEEAMKAKVESIRRHAYEAGWKDAKARRRKKTYFAKCINTPDTSVGY